MLEVPGAASGRKREQMPFSDIDDTDLDMIFRLQEDGRASAASVARSLGLDQRTVRRRVDRLIDEGIIRIAAVTDPAQLGYHSMALVCVKTSGSADHERLYQQIAELPEVDYFTLTSGRFDFQAEVFCENDAELHQVITREFRSRPEIVDVDVLYYLSLHYQSAWFGAVSKLYGKVGIRPLTLDSLDRQLVSLLAEDGRMTFEHLAAELEVSETLTRKRYNSLTRAGAMRVIAIANPLHLGYAATCWVAISCAASGRISEIADQLAHIEEVTYIAITAGSADLAVEIACRTHDELLKLIDTHVRPIPDIERAEIWLYFDLLYKPLLPLSPSRDANH